MYRSCVPLVQWLSEAVCPTSFHFNFILPTFRIKIREFVSQWVPDLYALIHIARPHFFYCFWWTIFNFSMERWTLVPHTRVTKTKCWTFDDTHFQIIVICQPHFDRKRNTFKANNCFLSTNIVSLNIVVFFFGCCQCLHVTYKF